MMENSNLSVSNLWIHPVLKDFDQLTNKYWDTLLKGDLLKIIPTISYKNTFSIDRFIKNLIELK